MSKEKPSFEFERAILEASALLVTLFFIILQLGEGWRNPVNVASICLLSFFFVTSAMLATIIMFLGSSIVGSPSKLASELAGALRGFESAFFICGLVGLSLILYGMTSVYYPAYGSLFLYSAAFFGTLLVIMFVSLVIISRWYRRKA
jgi:hypothetical protein